jgi:hypothetical protein
MRALAESIEKVTINTVLPGHSSFQESLDNFVSEFDSRFTPSGVRRRDCLNGDYVKVCGHEGNTLAIDFSDENWEWY